MWTSVIKSLLLPILNFLDNIFHPGRKGFMASFILFYGFIGLIYLVDSSHGDVYEYAEVFRAATGFHGGWLKYYLAQPYDQRIDFYYVTMTWLISRLTSNYHIYLGVLCAVMGALFSWNVSYLLKYVRQNNVYSMALLLLLLLIPNATYLTHRWWTAMQLFVAGVLPIMFDNNYKRIWLCVISVVVFHFSFVYPLIILIISILLPKKKVFPYLVLFYLSLIVQSFNFTELASYIEFLLPVSYAERTQLYIDATAHGQNLFAKSGPFVIKIINLVLITTIFVKDKVRLSIDTQLRNVFIIVILLASFANICTLTAWGWRYLQMSNFLLVAVYLFYIFDFRSFAKSKMILRVLAPLIIYYMLFQIRGYMDVLGPINVVCGNYITTWFLTDVRSIWSYI